MSRRRKKKADRVAEKDAATFTHTSKCYIFRPFWSEAPAKQALFVLWRLGAEKQGFSRVNTRHGD